ncbi:MAG: AraC family transcriptional regulator [Schleiferiaceae bacterium]|nr:AraC family transcriptional regulator [Schleiferiaceae bacterium]
MTAVSHLREWNHSFNLNIPALIMLDICEVNDSGETLMVELENKEMLNNVCTIMIAEHCSLNQRIQCLKNGAIDCIPTGMDSTEMILKIRNLLALCPRSKYSAPLEQTEKDRIISSIQKHMKDNLNVELLSKEMFMSRSSLQRACLRHFQTGPKEIITSFKIQHALRMIEFGSNNVASLAYSVGYMNVNNFIAAFKRIVDTTPKEYMKRRHAENQKLPNEVMVLVA